METRLAELERRLSLAEGQVQTLQEKQRRAARLVRLLCSLCLGAALSAWMLAAAGPGATQGTGAGSRAKPPKPPQPLTVKAPFVVVDNQGKKIFQVGTSPIGNLQVRGPVIYDTAGSPALAAVTAANGDRGFVLLNAAGNVVGLLSLTNDKGGELVLRNAAGEKRANLFADNQGGGLDLTDNSGNVWHAPPR